MTVKNLPFPTLQTSAGYFSTFCHIYSFIYVHGGLTPLKQNQVFPPSSLQTKNIFCRWHKTMRRCWQNFLSPSEGVEHRDNLLAAQLQSGLLGVAGAREGLNLPLRKQNLQRCS